MYNFGTDTWLGTLKSAHKLSLVTMPYRGVVFGKVVAPNKSFNGLVSHYIHVYRKGNVMQPPILYPGVDAGLAFSKTSDKFAAFAVGSRALPREGEYIANDTEYFCVLFSQLGGNAILPLDQSLLTDTALPLEAFFPKRSKELTEKICLATSTEAKIQVFETFLSGYMDKFKLMNKFKLMENEYIHEINKMALLADYRKCRKYTSKSAHTERHVRRLFLKYAGVSPKKFFRILRCQKALRLMTANPACNLADLAYMLDYYDQTHFINDFKAMYQLTPRAFINEFLSTPKAV